MPFINGLLFPFFDFVAKNRWAQIVLLLGIGWVILMIYLSVRDSGVRRVEREAQKARELKELGRVNDARLKATQENIDAAERADEAVRTMPRYLPDELREREPDVADIVLGPRRDGA